jgi:hypothetical protein
MILVGAVLTGPVGDHRDGRLVVPLLGEQLKRSHDESLARPVPSAACMH